MIKRLYNVATGLKSETQDQTNLVQYFWTSVLTSVKFETTLTRTHCPAQLLSLIFYMFFFCFYLFAVFFISLIFPCCDC